MDSKNKTKTQRVSETLESLAKCPGIRRLVVIIFKWVKRVTQPSDSWRGDDQTA